MTPKSGVFYTGGCVWAHQYPALSLACCIYWAVFLYILWITHQALNLSSPWKPGLAAENFWVFSQTQSPSQFAHHCYKPSVSLNVPLAPMDMGLREGCKIGPCLCLVFPLPNTETSQLGFGKDPFPHASPFSDSSPQML